MECLKKLRTELPCGRKISKFAATPLLGSWLPEKFENTYSRRYMHPYVHGSIILSGHDTEPTQVSFDRGLDEEEGVHTHQGIPLSHKKR